MFDEVVLRVLHVERSILQFHHSWARPFFKQSHLFAPFAARVLYSEQGQKGAPSSLLHRVLDELGVASTSDERLKALAVLYRQACDCIQQLPQPAWPSCRMPFTREGYAYSRAQKDRDSLSQSHLIPAAILLGISGHYEAVLVSSEVADDDAEKLMTEDSEHFGTPLYAAIKAHQNKLALSILSWMKRTNRRDSRDCIRAAVISNNAVMLQPLLQHTRWFIGDELGILRDALIEDERRNLWEGLVEAAKLGHVVVASYLFNHAREFHPQVINDFLLTESVQYASLWGHIDYLELLIRQGGVDLEARLHEEGCRANSLMIAAWRGDSELLHWLIRHGVRSGGADGEFKWGPIMAAIDGDQPEALRILFEAGIGVTISGDDWDEDFYRILVLQSNKAFRYLVLETSVVSRDPPDLYYWMAKACAWGNLGMFEVLLEAGVPVHIPLGVDDLDEPEGGTPVWTAMHFALASSMPGAENIVGKLLEMGVPKPRESDYESDAMGGFREGMFEPDYRTYWSSMPHSTKIGWT